MFPELAQRAKRFLLKFFQSKEPMPKASKPSIQQIIKMTNAMLKLERELLSFIIPLKNTIGATTYIIIRARLFLSISRKRPAI